MAMAARGCRSLIKRFSRGHAVLSSQIYTPVLVLQHSFCTSLCLNARKSSSKRWIQRQLSDPYVKKATEESYRCRSAFKLIEMDDKHKVFKAGDIVIDLGACPGSWSQVAVQRVNALGKEPKKPKGKVISVDLQHMQPVEGALMLHQSDFIQPATQMDILKLLDGARPHAIISDMAPNATGHLDLDRERIVDLAFCAFRFSMMILRPGGTFICKLWEGPDKVAIEKPMRQFFNSVSIVKPPSSRSESAEIFLLGKEFKGASR